MTTPADARLSIRLPAQLYNRLRTAAAGHAPEGPGQARTSKLSPISPTVRKALALYLDAHTPIAVYGEEDCHAAAL